MNVFTKYVGSSILKKNCFCGDNVTKILMEHSIVVFVKAQCPYSYWKTMKQKHIYT